MRHRRGRPMMFIDLAMPRDIAPDVAEVYNVYAYGLDDLESVAEENRRRRAREIPRAEAILEEELARFTAWFGNLAVVPTLTDLQRRLASLRDRELERLPAGRTRALPRLRGRDRRKAPARAPAPPQVRDRRLAQARPRRGHPPPLRPRRMRLRLGARGSALSLAQASLVAAVSCGPHRGRGRRSAHDRGPQVGGGRADLVEGRLHAGARRGAAIEERWTSPSTA